MSVRMVVRLCLVGAMLTMDFPPQGFTQEPTQDPTADHAEFTWEHPDVDVDACDRWWDEVACDSYLPVRRRRSIRDRVPGMIGDFFGGTPLGVRGDLAFDRLFVFASDLDAPNPLPAGGNVLTITEPGPVGIYESSLRSVQHAQTLLRNGDPLPGTNLSGVVTDDATLTTTNTISQIQAQVAGTPLAYDIILLQAPPATYDANVDATFQARNTTGGLTVFDSAGSGAMLEGGVDTLNGGEDLDAYYFYDYVIRFDTALANAASGGLGSLKLAEGGTVLPQDRAYFRYSYFDNVAFSSPRDGLSRFTPGFERTFFRGQMSLELRVPFATDAMTDSTAEGTSLSNGSNAEWGNLQLYWKTLLSEGETHAISGGLGVSSPTASDIDVKLADGTPLLKVNNDAVRLQPFLGWLYLPSDRWFVQAFTQFDFATGNNAVQVSSLGSGLRTVGTYREPSYFFGDIAVGYWAYRNDHSRGLTGVIPTVEVHQTSSLERAGVVTAGNLQVGNFRGSTSLTSAVVGSTLEFGQQTQLTFGYATPLGGGNDRQYDGALRFQFARAFGR